MLWRDVRRGSRKAQVLGSPRMPNAKVGHLPIRQGVEIMLTGMAPPSGTGVGWVRLSQILRPNYGFTLSSGHATCLTNPTTAQCQKLRGFIPCGVSHELDVGLHLTFSNDMPHVLYNESRWQHSRKGRQ